MVQPMLCKRGDEARAKLCNHPVDPSYMPRNVEDDFGISNQSFLLFLVLDALDPAFMNKIERCALFR